MPRNARIKSNTGIYHCIARGIDKQDIFLDDMDRNKFIKEIIRTKEKYLYELYAYCLMDNHVHIMIKDNTNEINKIMQSLMVAYSEYFNKKYERTGHLFQNRYLSKPVENERYTLILQRYIHQNPPNMKYYKWSSYNEYIHSAKIVDTYFILNLLSNDKNEAIKEFIKINSEIDNKGDAHLYTELEISEHINDSCAIEIIKKYLDIDNILEINKYNTEIRKEYIKQIMEIKGIKVNQLARILQIDKSIIKRINEARCVPNWGNCPKRETSPKEVRDGESNYNICVQ